jgi:hypothetical protein
MKTVYKKTVAPVNCGVFLEAASVSNSRVYFKKENKGASTSRYCARHLLSKLTGTIMVHSLKKLRIVKKKYTIRKY